MRSGRARADVDLLVDFGDSDGCAKAHAYFALLDASRDLLGTEVDLVMVAAVKNRYIAREIERTQRRLDASSRRSVPGGCHRGV